MSREAHVRFCESRGVRFPPATHQAPGRGPVKYFLMRAGDHPPVVVVAPR